MNRKPSRWDNRLPLLASGLMLALLLLNFWFPANGCRADKTTITIVNNPFAPVLIIFGILAWLGCLAATIFASVRKSKVGYFTAILFVVMPLAYLFVTSEEDIYRVEASVVDRSGITYCFLFPSPGRSDAYLAKLVEKSGIHATYEKLVLGDLDSADGNFSLVRPKGATKTPLLFLTHNNFLVGNIFDVISVCAYDLDHKVGYHFEELNKLSPFILLAKDDTPSEEDFRALCKSAGFVDPKSYEADLENPNPRARQMAQELLEIQRKADSTKH